MPTEQPSSHNAQPESVGALEVDALDLETALQSSVLPLPG